MKTTIPVDMAGMRLDQALARLVPGESRTRLARLVEEGHVKVDGALPASPRVKLRSGETVEVAFEPRAVEGAPRAQAIALTVVHEDEDVAVIDKPPGLVVHPGSGNREGTLLNALLHHAPASAELPRGGIVHRLDKDTSGLLVVALNERAQLALVRQLQERTVKRTYLAVARGKVAAEGTIDKPIGRHPVHRTRMAVVAGGKRAVTRFRAKQRFAAHTFLECDLETGRTHQIRVHLAAIGHPIEGDPVYAGRGPKLIGRQALHAWKLAFAHPANGKAMSFESALPPDMAELLQRLRA